jgi:hypothetical protein
MWEVPSSNFQGTGSFPSKYWLILKYIVTSPFQFITYHYEHVPNSEDAFNFCSGKSVIKKSQESVINLYYYLRLTSVYCPVVTFTCIQKSRGLQSLTWLIEHIVGWVSAEKLSIMKQ